MLSFEHHSFIFASHTLTFLIVTKCLEQTHTKKYKWFTDTEFKKEEIANAKKVYIIIYFKY